jgi:hypothetical protein
MTRVRCTYPLTEGPLPSIRQSLQGVKWQAQSQLQAVTAAQARPSPAYDAGRIELFGELGGAIGGEFFGKRRVGAKIGRALAVRSARTQRAQRDLADRNQAAALVHQLRQLVETASPALGHRFASSLRRNLADAEAAERTSTILRKVLRVAARLETFRLAPPRVHAAAESMETLHALEQGLRGCIEGRLSAITPTWWMDRVPVQIRSRAEGWKARRDHVWPWLTGGDYSVVEYLGFPDYARIILEPGNWNQAFSVVFTDKASLEVKLRELEPIRTDLAHSRRLTPANHRRLATYSADILAAINRRS